MQPQHGLLPPIKTAPREKKAIIPIHNIADNRLRQTSHLLTTLELIEFRRVTLGQRSKQTGCERQEVQLNRCYIVHPVFSNILLFVLRHDTAQHTATRLLQYSPCILISAEHEERSY